MTREPLLTTLLDLDAALGGDPRLIVGGGYGLYLKQLHLRNHPEIRTLFPLEGLPHARTTEDIDLILRADIVTDSESMKRIRAALDQLGFTAVEYYTQFVRDMSPGEVKLDLLAAPLGELSSRVAKDTRRVKPRPRVNLHARKMEEALAVERHGLLLPLQGHLSSGASHQTVIQIPQAFTYLLMKLCAYRDRLGDARKDLGRHHALDLYRIVGMLTEDEDSDVRPLLMEFGDHPIVIGAREVAVHHFVSPNGLGRIRIREHPLHQSTMDLDRFGDELNILLSK